MTKFVWLLVLAAHFLAVVRSTGGLPDISADTTCSVGEDQWFCAKDHFDEIAQWAKAFDGPRTVHLVDVFGASQRLSRKWSKHGYASRAYDIKLSTEEAPQDILTRNGFFQLLQWLLELVPFGIAFCGPPCSLFIGASSSVHRRRTWRLYGDCSRFCVRLANAIWSNWAVCMQVVLSLGRDIYACYEQPACSWGFKLPELVMQMEKFQLKTTLTWMSFFNHDLLKPTHLVGNFRMIDKLKRTMTSETRRRHKERFEKRNAKRAHPRQYHTRVKKSDGTIGWQGGPDLAKSAAYPGPFCAALFKIWSEHFCAVTK